MTLVFDNSSFSTDSWESTDTNLTFESSDNQDLVRKMVHPLSPLPLFVSSACSLAVLKYQLKDLNEIIKNIIKTICYHNLIACILIILSGIYLYFTHDSSPVICNLSVYAIGRSLTYNEDRILKRQCLNLREKDYGMLDIVKFIITSDLFLKK